MLNNIETNAIEYKREYTGTILKDVIGFLNYPLGGHIYVGVSNNGAVYGVEDVDATQLQNMVIVHLSKQLNQFLTD